MEVSLGYQLLDGRDTARRIKEQLSAEVSDLVSEGMRPPHLAAVLVGEDPASETYVGAKVRACERVGFRSTLVQLSATTTEDELLEKVAQLNADTDLDGFIVQLPLPAHINAQRVTLAIDPDKDVDGFHPTNVGRMVLGEESLLPATPSGILELLKHNGIKTAGKHCVVIGRSNIVGKPMALLMARNAEPGNCTVTIAHSRTMDLAAITREADILIAAAGKPKLITEDMVKEGAVVVDVGIHRIADTTRERGYRLVGDVDFDGVAPKCNAITPVPGGVGPMTIASLLLNTMKAYRTAGTSPAL